MGIGNRIKKYRLNKGLKGVEFSKIIGISSGSLSELEKENTKPSADTIISIINKTDINVYWLLIGKGEMEVSNLFKYDLLKQTIKTVEDIFKEKDIALQSDKKAEMIVFLFEDLLKKEVKIEDLREKIIKLMKFVSK